MSRRPASAAGCTFCDIVAARAPARWASPPTPGRLAVAFHNRLRWSRVMLLVVPVAHTTQQELWSGKEPGDAEPRPSGCSDRYQSANDALRAAAGLAVALGERECPEGFRLLSNFGRWAHQSQPHAHIHVVSGIAAEPERAVLGTGRPEGAPAAIEAVLASVPGVPWAVRLSSLGATSQRALWTGEALPALARSALDLARRRSRRGFRLIANFPPVDQGSRSERPGMFVLGGGQLDLYV